MKILVIIIGAAMLVVGCSHKPDERDAKIAKLEARVTELETRQDKLRSAYTNLLDFVRNANAENVAALLKIETIAKGNQENWHSAIELLSTLTNTPSKQVVTSRYIAPLQSQRNAYATKDGVPIAVYNQIAANAAKEWPGDYRMQASEIKNQVEAYLRLHR